MRLYLLRPISNSLSQPSSASVTLRGDRPSQTNSPDNVPEPDYGSRLDFKQIKDGILTVGSAKPKKA